MVTPVPSLISRTCLIFPRCKNTITIRSSGYATDEGVSEGNPNSGFAPILGYKVNSLVIVTMKPMVDILREMFEIPGDIWIILHGNVILRNRILEGSLFLRISYLLGLDFHSYRWCDNFFVG